MNYAINNGLRPNLDRIAYKRGKPSRLALSIIAAIGKRSYSPEEIRNILLNEKLPIGNVSLKTNSGNACLYNTLQQLRKVNLLIKTGRGRGCLYRVSSDLYA